MSETSFSLNLPKELKQCLSEVVNQEGTTCIERDVDSPVNAGGVVNTSNSLGGQDAQRLLYSMIMRQQQLYSIMAMNSCLFNNSTYGKVFTNNTFLN
jgi:hypothetical protein